MYRCQFCGGVAPAGTPATRVVIARRPVTYPPRPNANRRRYRAGVGRFYYRPWDDPGGVGWEIAREAVACPGCAATTAGSPPPGS